MIRNIMLYVAYPLASIILGFLLAPNFNITNFLVHIATGYLFVLLYGIAWDLDAVPRTKIVFSAWTKVMTNQLTEIKVWAEHLLMASLILSVGTLLFSNNPIVVTSPFMLGMMAMLSVDVTLHFLTLRLERAKFEFIE